jgi:hypothetical protein
VYPYMHFALLTSLKSLLYHTMCSLSRGLHHRTFSGKGLRWSSYSLRSRVSEQYQSVLSDLCTGAPERFNPNTTFARVLDWVAFTSSASAYRHSNKH